MFRSLKLGLLSSIDDRGLELMVCLCIGETAAAGGVLTGLGLRGVLEIAVAAATAAAAAVGLP